MKLLNFISFAFIFFIHQQATADWKQRLDEVEKEYLLSGDSLEEINARINTNQTLHKSLNIPSDQPIYYDPIFWTFSSAIEANKHQENLSWNDIILPPLKENNKDKYYQKSIPAYFLSSANSDTLFIIRNGTYASWKYKMWVVKVAQLLNQLYHPNILTFSGFLTSEYLEASPLFPDFVGDIMTKDLYQRLVILVNKMNETRDTYITKVGLVGVSGGASEVIELLKIDKENSFFNMGGIAFSPVIDLLTTFNNFDSFADELVKKHGDDSLSSATLTTFSNWKTLSVLFDLFTFSFNGDFFPFLIDPSVSILMKKTERTESEEEKTFKTLFMNRFIVSYLQKMIEGFEDSRIEGIDYLQKPFKWISTTEKSDYNSEEPSGNRYRDFWFKYSLEARRLYLYTPFVTLEELTRIESKFYHISDKLYVVFCKDDPILFNYGFYNPENVKYKYFPPEVEEFITNNHQKNIKFFTPMAGAHMAYFLDTNWIKNTLQAFFSDSFSDPTDSPTKALRFN